MSAVTPPDNIELYNACLHGSAAEQSVAYSRLWTYLYPIVYFLVRRQPDGEDLAKDCTQLALVRIYQHLIECQEPMFFRAWARRIATNLTIDELRRLGRFTSVREQENPEQSLIQTNEIATIPEAALLAKISIDRLREMIQQAPISDRSRRVVIGRYLDGLEDEMLALIESELTQSEVLPRHVQVTRAKNLAKLRGWKPLQAYLRTE